MIRNFLNTKHLSDVEIYKKYIMLICIFSIIYYCVILYDKDSFKNTINEENKKLSLY